MSSIPVELGNPLPLSLTLSDGAMQLYPQAHIYDKNDVEVTGSPFDLIEQDEGRYTNTDCIPLTKGTFTAKFIVYLHQDHRVESPIHSRVQETYIVTDFINMINDIKVNVLANKIAIIAEIDENETKLDVIQADLTAATVIIQALYDYRYGKWEIKNNQLIICKPDNETVIARFNLFDQFGKAATEDVFCREKIG